MPALFSAGSCSCSPFLWLPLHACERRESSQKKNKKPPNINYCRTKSSYDYSGSNAVDKPLKSKNNELGAHLWPITDMHSKGPGIKATEAQMPMASFKGIVERREEHERNELPVPESLLMADEDAQVRDEKVGQIQKQQ